MLNQTLFQIPNVLFLIHVLVTSVNHEHLVCKTEPVLMPVEFGLVDIYCILSLKDLIREVRLWERGSNNRDIIVTIETTKQRGITYHQTPLQKVQNQYHINKNMTITNHAVWKCV